MIYLPLGLLALFAAAFLWVHIKSRDYWPFSPYPMFSQRLDYTQLDQWCLALETRDGERIWWRPHYYNYLKTFHNNIRRAQKRDGGAEWGPAMRLFLGHLAHLIELEEGSLTRYAAFCLMRRRVRRDASGAFAIDDQLQRRIPLHTLRPDESDA